MLNVVTPERAIEIISSEFSPLDMSEYIRVSDASGRILNEDIYSDENIPAFDRSTVDGFALRASDTYGAGENMPALLNIRGEILMGEKAEMTVSCGECVKISTGGMLPAGADSVIMVEHTDTGFEGMCLCLKSVSPFENVTRKGEDTKQGDKLLSKGTVISSSDAGILCAVGKTHIKCVKKITVGVFSTGDEIVDICEKPLPGQVRDINSVLLESLLKENGCSVINYGIVRDKKAELVSTFNKALAECDAVIMSGGSSKGERDMTAEIIRENGELLFHGLAMKPGKPTIFGKCNGKAVFGLPGHPAAAYYVALRLVLPFIYHLYGKKYVPRSGKYILSTDIPSNHGREEIVPVRLENGKAVPVFGKSGLVTLLSASDGYIIIDRNREGAFKDEETEVYFTK